MRTSEPKRTKALPVTRRGLLQGSAALGTAAMVGPLGAGSAAAEPKKGGTFRVGMAHGGTSDNYDPALWTHAYVQVFATARHGNLTEVASDGSLVGEVAESWEASPDAKTWTFKIRPGIEFHSGKTLDGNDVVASFNYHRGEDSKSAVKPFVDPIEEIKVDGDYVVISLNAGNADFPFIASDYHIPIMPAKGDTIDPTSSDGVGAYKVESYEPGVRAEMSRNPNYWKGRPWSFRWHRTSDHP